MQRRLAVALVAVLGVVGVACSGPGSPSRPSATSSTTQGAPRSSGISYLYRTRNLSDLASAATARTNLGLGTAATSASTAFTDATKFTPRSRKAAKWYSVPRGVSSTMVQTLSRMYLIEFEVQVPHGIDRVGVNASAGAASSAVRLGIYNDNGGYPGSLLADDGTVASTGTGSLTITVSHSLATGHYWAAVVSQGGTPTLFSAASNNNNDPWEPQQSQGQVFAACLFQDSVTAGLPDPAVATGDIHTCPFFQFRAA